MEVQAIVASDKHTAKTSSIIDEATVSISSDRRHMTVRSAVSIRAPAEMVAAGYLTYFGSRTHAIIAAEDKATITNLLEQDGMRKKIIRMRSFLPAPFSDREFL